MGRTYIYTLADVSDNGMVLLLECRCGRKRWMAANDLIGRKVNGHMVHRHHEYTDVARQMRCAGCNHRGPGIKPLYPREAGVPNGVPVLPYLQADDREKKRMIQKARG